LWQIESAFPPLAAPCTMCSVSAGAAEASTSCCPAGHSWGVGAGRAAATPHPVWRWDSGHYHRFSRFISPLALNRCRCMSLAPGRDSAAARWPVSPALTCSICLLWGPDARPLCPRLVANLFPPSLWPATMPSPTSAPTLPPPPAPYRRHIATLLPLCLVCVVAPVLLTAALRFRSPPSSSSAIATATGGVKEAFQTDEVATALAAAATPADVLAAATSLTGADRCGLWGMVGRCRALLPRYQWRYGRCDKFMWGGCEGLVPFETAADCAAAKCETAVAVAGEGGLTAAVREAWERVGGKVGRGGMPPATLRRLL